MDELDELLNQMINQKKQKDLAKPQPNIFNIVTDPEVVINPEQQFQIYIGNLPRGVTDAEILDTFRGCGDIKNVHIKQEAGFGFVNFTRKEGAMNALMQRDFIIRGQKAVLIGFHKQLQIILRRIPPKAQDEIRFQTCVTKYLHQRHPGLFCFVQIKAEHIVGCSAYLHFLFKEDSINAFETLKTTDFTKFAIRELQIVSNPDSAKIVSNEEVERRQAFGETLIQDLDSEVLQFQCLKYSRTQHMYQKSFYCDRYNQSLPRYLYQPEFFVYLEMMPMGTNDQQVTQSMNQFGSVTSVTLINDKEHIGMNPCAIVFFRQPKYADAALRSGHQWGSSQREEDMRDINYFILILKHQQRFFEKQKYNIEVNYTWVFLTLFDYRTQFLFKIRYFLLKNFILTLLFLDLKFFYFCKFSSVFNLCVIQYTGPKLPRKKRIYFYQQ
ncbi:RNA_recognition motif-containing protein [Hexamita inflata]|uniref:RNA recognition motif-containing protein n=1 Tax=Hexamita inflata TaxID=28002 RepID=A0AA86P7P9_9EUKA|nr:RNA recognition motif-containing protein [Hexamita inflata]